MKFNMKKRPIALTTALLLSAVAAVAADDKGIVEEQNAIFKKLDSLNAAVLGLKLNGTAKAGALASMATSDQFSDDSPTNETQAFTDVDLKLTARPSSETMVTLKLRLHKDWQSAFDENNNPVIGHWFSYDGSILNNHLDFNLGYMRVGYTPLTVYSPQPFLLQEPEIFAEKRIETLEQRNLDTTSRRLMQGINADYHSGNLGPVDDIHVQATGARLRNTAKKEDQIFFDFDFSDRYFYGGRLGVSAFGANLGVNYTDVFDRKLSRRSRQIASTDTVVYEDNSIFSAELGFNSNKLLGNLPISFGLNGEFAMSHWEADRDYLVKKENTDYVIREGRVPDEIGELPSASSPNLVYVVKQTSTEDVYFNEEYGETDGTSFYVEPFVNGNFGAVEFAVKGMYLQTDEDFWSEMASAPNYRGNTVVLNANAIYQNDIYDGLINTFGMSSLENLYYAVYNSNPLNATNLLNSGSRNVLTNGAESGQYTYSRLYNNYKNAHFYRNGYDGATIKRMELGDALLALDPSVNMVMPFGLATPDRKGFSANLEVKVLDALTVNAYFAQMTQGAVLAGIDEAGNAITAENKFMEYAVGLSVDIGRFVPSLNRKILIQGSYDHSEEDAYFERKSDRIMAGLSADIWGPIAIQAGYQMSNKEFGKALAVNEYFSIAKADESLLLVGPKIRIAPNSYLTVQYGMLTNSVEFNYMVPALDETGSETGELNMGTSELSIDKSVIAADITVNF